MSATQTKSMLAEAMDLLRVGLDAGWDRGDLTTAQELVERFDATQSSTNDPVAILGFRADELKGIRAFHSPSGAVPMPVLADSIGRIESAIRHAMTLIETRTA